MSTVFSLDGYTALITGAGSGIGAATAVEMAQAGAAKLILVGRDAKKLEHTAQAVGAINAGCQVYRVAADLAVHADRARVVEQAKLLGSLDVLVNNAGCFVSAPIRETEDASLDQCFILNASVPFFLTRDLLELLSRSKHASVINISSTLAQKAIPGASAYNASKAALGQLTRTLALELGPEGVRVNAILPAIVDTPMYRSRFVDEKSFIESTAAVDQLHPLGRMGQPRDIAMAVVFLASPAAGWITGVELPVDGGMLVT